jgi:aflatoxin B1 aldehyde reductase
MPKAPIANIIFGTMTLGYGGYGARVHDAATADAMLGTVSEFGHDQLDTCSDYGDGTCEQMLGELCAAERFGIATRIHPGNTRGHEPENLKRVFKESLGPPEDRQGQDPLFGDARQRHADRIDTVGRSGTS